MEILLKSLIYKIYTFVCDEKCCKKKINFEFHKLLLLPLLLPKRHYVGIKERKFIGVFLPPDIIFQHIFTLIFFPLFSMLKAIKRICNSWIYYYKKAIKCERSLTWTAYLCPTVVVIFAINNVASALFLITKIPSSYKTSVYFFN